MLRGPLIVLALLVGIGFSFADGQRSLLADELASETRWEQGRRYLAEGKAAEAKRVFEDLLNKYPKEPDLHLFLGITLLRLRAAEAAEVAIRKAIALEPDHAEARTLLGWLHSEVHGNLDAAVREYTRVIELRPDFPEAYNNLGAALKQKGKLDEALESFNRALQLRPDYSEALSNRGWIYSQRSQWAEARSDFERALEINPHDDGALYGLSQVLREARDYAGAQKALSRLMSRSPNFVYWLEWGRVGLIRYYWVLLLIAAAFFVKGRLRKARKEAIGGGTNQEA
jgi:Tfp pilus assembly protein PilF